MGLEKRTIKIIVIVAVVVLIIGGLIGLLLGLLLPHRYVELEIWPRSPDDTYNQPLIRFNPDNTGSWHDWYARTNDFLREYETTTPEVPPRAPCSTHNQMDQVHRTEPCNVAMKIWTPCTADYFYGYNIGKPCVFLRLGYIHYWVPEPYNISTNLPIPPEMPRHIQQALRQYPAHNFGDFVWVSCEGEFPSDQENIGPIQYIPAGMPPGFSMKRLHTADRIPYVARNLPDDTPGPVMAVLFENPRRGVLINVECRIWTRDIYYDRSSRVGRTRFELYID